MQRRAILTAVAVLALAGCKSTEQKQQDLNAELQTVTTQYNKDCPKFDEHDTTGISAALGTKPSPSQTAATHSTSSKYRPISIVRIARSWTRGGTT